MYRLRYCEKERKGKKNLYKEAESYYNFKHVEEMDWDIEMFMKPHAIEGHIWEVSTEDAFIIPCSENSVLKKTMYR